MTLKRVLECLPAITEIAKARTLKRRLFLLEKAKDCVYYAISEVSLNILQGSVPVSTRRIKTLQKYKTTIRKIASKDLKLPTRKRLIIQSGGFLPSLLIPAVTFLAEIIAKKI